MTCDGCPDCVEWPARAARYAERCRERGTGPDPDYPARVCLRSPDAPYPVSGNRTVCLWEEPE